MTHSRCQLFEYLPLWAYILPSKWDLPSPSGSPGQVWLQAWLFFLPPCFVIPAKASLFPVLEFPSSAMRGTGDVSFQECFAPGDHEKCFLFYPHPAFYGGETVHFFVFFTGDRIRINMWKYKRHIFALNEEKLSTNEKRLKIMVKHSCLQEVFTGVTEGIQALHGKMTKVSLQVPSSIVLQCFIN